MNRKLIATVLVCLLIGIVVGFVIGFLREREQYTKLEENYTTLVTEFNHLEQNYTWLKQHSFTNYTFGDSINISSVEIEIDTEKGWTTVKGNITNISNKAIKEVYVYAILENPDGTRYFKGYSFDRIVDLYIRESADFDIPLYSYVEGQTVEILLVY